MQFLKSTLFPNLTKTTQNKDKLIKTLERRVSLLEEENKKSAEAIQEMTDYISQISVVITTLAGELVQVGTQVASLVESDELGSLKAYLKPDDDGYIH